MSLYVRTQRKARRELLAWTSGLRRTARAAVIGCGQIAPEHLAGYTESGVATVVAISDVRAGAMAPHLRRYPKVRGFRDYHQMLETMRPDVVSICTWPQDHLKIIKSAVQHSIKGVFCEKPMALQMSEVTEMLRVCKEADVKLSIGHQYRFHPYFAKAAAMIARGELGRVVAVRGNVQDSVANNGPHLLDTIRFLLADRPVRRVSASFEAVGNRMNRGWPMEDGARGELTFDDGLVAHVSLGKFSPTFFDIEIVGEKASLQIGVQGIWRSGKRLPADDSDSAWYWCRRRQFGEFVQWARGRRAAYAADGKTGACSTELVLAMYESGRQGGPVDLPLSFEGDIISEFFRETLLASSLASAATPNLAHARRAPGIPRDTDLAMDGGPRTVRSWPAGHPHFGLGEAVGLTRVMISRNLNAVGGTEVVALEREFAAMYGAPKAVASTSGTAAIHVAVAAINPDPCDEIVTTPMSDMGTVIPIMLANCIPVFADVDPITGNLTAESIATRITHRTRAVIVVHLFGRPADMGPIQELLRARGVALIEDCSQAHLAEYRGRKVGTFGDLGCFSLQQSKQITCGDGGVTLVNRQDLIERASLFVDKGRSRKAGRVHLFLGQNYRMTELQGAVARAQLRKALALIEARRAAATALTARLQQMAGVVLPDDADVRPAWWLYNWLIDEERLGVGADEFCDALCVEGVPAMRQYLPRPLFEEDVIAKRKTFGQSGYPFSAVEYVPPRREDFPGLEEFLRRQIIMEWNSRITSKDIDSAARAIGKLLRAITRVERQDRHQEEAHLASR
jgi:perosamine synthetase